MRPIVLWCALFSLFNGIARAEPSNRQLPFMAGETWWCSQGWLNGWSHSNEKAWDFNWGYSSSDLGKPIVAPAAGTVVYAANTGGSYGKVVVIEYGDGSYERIAHCDRTVAVLGEAVVQGQVVAFCGGTGGWPVHVHINLQSVESATDDGDNTASSSFHYNYNGTSQYGVPSCCNCESGDVPTYRATSENSYVVDREVTTNGGASKFGTLDPNWVTQVNPSGIHWYHVYNPNDLYFGNGVPKNCYVQNWGGGPYGNCGVVYDALGGARRAYTVRTGFWDNHAGQGYSGWAWNTGPTSALGMPITNEYETDPGFIARQDFVLGWLNWVGGVAAVHPWSVCAPGWTANGWNAQVSYRIADVYEKTGKSLRYGEPTGVAALSGSEWVQSFANGETIRVPVDYGVGGQGGPEPCTVLYPIKAFTYDFDGDGLTDLWDRTSTGQWHLDRSSIEGFNGWDWTGEGYGGSADTPAPADFDGDGRVDLAILKDSNRVWYIDYACDGYNGWEDDFGGYGGTTDYPVPADYDGDNIADISVRDADGEWHIDYFAQGGGFGGWDWTNGGYGGFYDRPAPADYDGDGKCDLAILRDSDRKWFIDYAANGFTGWEETLGGYGAWGDLPCPADYDGDGQYDISIRASAGYWNIDFAYNGFGAWDFTGTGYGGAGDLPRPGRYNSDFRDDLAIWKTSQSLLCYDLATIAGPPTWGFGGYDFCKDPDHPTWGPEQWPKPEPEKPLTFTTSSHPNPFNPSVTISYTLPSGSHVRLDVFDVTGKRVVTLVNRKEDRGEHRVEWNAAGYSSGVYFYRLTAGEHSATRKLVLLK